MAVVWCFSREVLEHQTPSRDHGISWMTEKRYRKEGAKFIADASNTLGLRHDTLATGTVFYHRFFMVQSFRDFNRWIVAAACLLLAGKVEETPKKCRDILKVSKSLLTGEQLVGFRTENKEELLAHERVLLQTLKFDLQVQHPYNYLLKYAKSVKGEKSKIERIVQMAWTFINDSLCTTLCLQWEPKAIAVAFLYLAGKMAKFDLQASMQSRSRYWWRMFVETLDQHDLEGICHQVLDLYNEDDKKQSEENPESVEEPIPPPPPPPMPATGTVATTAVATPHPPIPPQIPLALTNQPPHVPTGIQAQASVPYLQSQALAYGMSNPLQTLVPPTSLALQSSTHPSTVLQPMSLLGAPPQQGTQATYPSYAIQHQSAAVAQLYASSTPQVRAGTLAASPAVAQQAYLPTNTPPAAYMTTPTNPHLATGTQLSYSPSVPLPPSQSSYHPPPPPPPSGNWMRR